MKSVDFFCYHVEQSLRVGVQLQYSNYTHNFFLNMRAVVRGCDMQILLPKSGLQFTQ